MKIERFPHTTRTLIYVLPLLMGTVEYLLRVGFRQPDQDAFFPVSLTVAGIGLFVALTAVPARDGGPLPTLEHRSVAMLGLWMAIVGMVGWIYLLMASFSKEVREIVDVSPYFVAGGYYFLGTLATEWTARRI